MFWVWLGLTTNVYDTLAQPVLRSVSQYDYQMLGSADSVLLVESRFEYDDRKRLLLQVVRRYDPVARKLMSVDTFRYDALTNSSYQRIEHAKNTGENTSQRCRYLHYDAESSKHLPVWVGYYDHVGELLREDTFRYDAARRLLEKVTYRYTGGTALLSEVYRYNSKGLLRRWETWSRWYTINLAQKPVMRKSRRRLYRYAYNSAGAVARVWGKYYDETYDEHNKYYADGRTLLAKHIVETVPVSTKKVGERRNTRSVIVKTRLTEYNAYGKPVLFRRVRNDKEEERCVSMYQLDTLLERQDYYTEGRLVRYVTYDYLGGQRVRLQEIKLATDGHTPVSRRVETYDPTTGKIVSDVLETLPVVVSHQASTLPPARVLTWHYNERGYPTVMRHDVAGRPHRRVYYEQEFFLAK